MPLPFFYIYVPPPLPHRRCVWGAFFGGGTIDIPKLAFLRSFREGGPLKDDHSSELQVLSD